MREQCLVLDLHGVITLVGDIVTHRLAPFIQARKPGVCVERVRELYLTASAGRMSARRFWAATLLGTPYREVQPEYLNTLPMDPEAPAVLETLGRRYRLALLTNDLTEWSQFLRERFDLDRHFDPIVVSAEVCARKPEPKIYEFLLERVGLRASACAFVDDRRVNLRPAAELGMKTIWFARDPAGDAPFAADAQVRTWGELPAVTELFLR